jgi:hypothetical protein
MDEQKTIHSNHWLLGLGLRIQIYPIGTYKLQKNRYSKRLVMRLRNKQFQ